ncbi:MAG TPA: transcription termination/antitermination protein NusA [Acholeplasmataceae bacterium]|nr:transcription termination/antitermination protein NusA [Acholeplasmataceae bacterium]
MSKKSTISEDIDLIVKEMELERNDVVEAFKEGMIAGCKKEFNVKTCRVDLDEEANELSIYTQKLVIDDITLDEKIMTTIMLADAKKINSKIKVGDILEEKVSPTDFGYHASSQVKQRFNEILNRLTKEKVFNHFKKLESQMISAQVVGIDEAKGNHDKRYRLNIGQDTITFLNQRDTLPNDNLQVGDRVNVYVTKVEEGKNFQVSVSRTNADLVVKLMENYVPEIKAGIVEIISIAREAGDRSKVGVISHDPNVDPIGACIGDQGMRIRGVTKALNGEKIDLFKHSDDPKELISNALQPARVIAVTQIDPTASTPRALAIVQDDHLSLAIGKAGQNVRLAVTATGWSIDIKSEQMALDEGIIF